MDKPQLKVYKASAGSGKTYTLAQEYIKLLLENPTPHNYRHILAVTFTKDATGEMKDRILSELYGLAFDTLDSVDFLHTLQEKLQNEGFAMSETDIRKKSKTVLFAMLHDFSRLHITTIDSFFQRVLRNLARELGTGSRFNIEMDTRKVLREAVHATIEKAGENEQLLAWLTAYIESKLDEGKNWRIEEEILNFSMFIYNEFFQANEHSLRRQLTDNPELFRELARQHQQLQRQCRIFLEEAGAIFQRSLTVNGLELSDFGNYRHTVNYINKLAQGDLKPPGATVLKSLASADHWAAAKTPNRDLIRNQAAGQWISLLGEMLDVRNRYLTSRMITRNLHQLGLIWDISNEIGRTNAENNRFMLSDTALFLHRMIDRSDAPFIYEKVGGEIRHVMIDEFQDTSRLQWGNFKVLLENILSDNHFSLIVGDVKQSIYRWRNGDWRILNRIDSELNVVTEKLPYNYRSEREVIDFNNFFFTQSALLLDGLFHDEFGDSVVAPFRSIYSREEVEQQSRKKETKGFVSVTLLAEEKDKGRAFAEVMHDGVFTQLKQLAEQGVAAGDICILTRKNNEIAAIADYLATIRNDHPELAARGYLSIVSNDAFQLQSSPALKLIIQALYVIADPSDQVHREQLHFFLKTILGWDDETIAAFHLPIDELVTMPLFELVGYLYRRMSLKAIPEQSAYLFTFFDALSIYLRNQPADLETFLAYWQENLSQQAVPGGGALEGVRAMTIHKSKGLQFHTVILPYCSWMLSPRDATVWCGRKEGLYDLNVFPITYNEGMNETVFAEEYQEETVQTWVDNLNVLYVAFTRAERNLLVLGKFDPSAKKLATVSNLLQRVINTDRAGEENDESVYLRGTIEPSRDKEEQPNDNLLKQIPPTRSIAFVSEEFVPGKSIFKQSNQSREFTHPDRPTKESYVKRGNVMHNLYAEIITPKDIERAVDKFIAEGFIDPTLREETITNVRRSVTHAEVSDWFSDRYLTYQELEIILEEAGEVVTRRPDRVLIDGQSAKVIDFKFGQPKKSYHRQVEGYKQLLYKMGYTEVEGYLWYVDNNEVVAV